MIKKTIIIGVALLILIAIGGCTKNKFKLTRSQPTDIPYYNPVNDTCFICHNVSTLKKTITTSLGAETVPLYVNRDKFARSLHRGKNCQDCHTDIVLHKGHPDVPKTYGGWANFSAEDTLLTRNYTTHAAIACANCHTDHADFLSSQHYLIGRIKSSHMEINQDNGLQIGKDYDKAKCGKCHLTCATCHFKGVWIRKTYGVEVTDLWSQLLNGQSEQAADDMTNWAIDWTANVESHDFNVAEDLQNSNALCGLCHTGYYTSYNTTGYYHATIKDTLNWVSLVSQGIQKYPQYEEWSFLSGNITVNSGIGYLDDTVYNVVRNESHYGRLCLDCHNQQPADIHALSIPRCQNCHDVSFNKFGNSIAPHQDIGCEACHGASLGVFRVQYSIIPPADTVRAAVIKDNKAIDWRSHMIINLEEMPNFCYRKCHNPVTGPTIGAPWTGSHSGNIHD